MTATLVRYLALYVHDMVVQLGASMTSQKWTCTAYYKCSRHSWRQKQYESEFVCCIFSPNQADSRNLSSLKATWQLHLRHQVHKCQNCPCFYKIAVEPTTLLPPVKRTFIQKYRAWSFHNVTWKTSIINIWTVHVRLSVMDVLHFPSVALSVRVSWALLWRCQTVSL